jgi:gamma-glutamyltranspeptidase/glutathione hydrolase/leukotriene-C4 hydrolase
VVLNCVLVLVLMGVVTFRGASVTPSNAKTGETNTHRHTTNTHVETDLGLVAADEPRCSEVRIARFPNPNTVCIDKTDTFLFQSQIGAAVLEDGGVAVDAAVATALCLGVVHPHSSGIGGGAFAVVFDAKNGTSEVIEFREEAPGGASFDMFSNGSGSGSGVGELRGSEFGGGAVAVPSELAGLHLAWTRHGVLPWPRLVAPSMELAKGFIIGPALAEAIESEKKNLALFEQTKSIFLNENGSAKQRGDVLRNPRLAETLRLVSEFGSEVLRTGALAEVLALDIQQAGGFVTKEDLAQYAPRVLQPLSFHALGYEILGVPPPSSGGASLGLILEFMAGFLGEADGRPPSQLDRGTQQHRLVEAFKHAFAMRGNLGDLKGDGNFAGDENLNISGALGDMLDPVFVNELRQMTNDAHTLPVEEYGARWNQVTDSGTTHVSVVDRFGNAVALTSTINTPFGSKVRLAFPKSQDCLTIQY